MKLYMYVQHVPYMYILHINLHMATMVAQDTCKCYAFQASHVALCCCRYGLPFSKSTVEIYSMGMLCLVRGASAVLATQSNKLTTLYLYRFLQYGHTVQ